MRLKCAFSRNPRIQPLADGEVTIDGVETEWEFGNSGDLHLHHLTKDTFDVFEFSISNYLILQENLDRAHVRWKAIPIFLSKALLSLRFHVHETSGIQSFADLRGKRVGVPDYHMTAAIWMRIVLRHMYGIEPRDVQWFNGRSADYTHGEDVGSALNPDISITRAQEPGALDRLLHSGELDGGFGDDRTAAVTPGNGVRPLFTGGQGAELIAEFRRKTGQTPVNHVLMVQERLVRDDPTLAMRLFEGFERSKQAAYNRARQAAPGYLLFAPADFARQAQLFGEDPFPSGLAANRALLEMVLEEEVAEGLVTKRPNIDDLFAAATRGT